MFCWVTCRVGLMGNVSRRSGRLVATARKNNGRASSPWLAPGRQARLRSELKSGTGSPMSKAPCSMSLKRNVRRVGRCTGQLLLLAELYKLCAIFLWLYARLNINPSGTYFRRWVTPTSRQLDLRTINLDFKRSTLLTWLADGQWRIAED